MSNHKVSFPESQVNENNPSLLNRRWSTLSSEERARLPVGTRLDRDTVKTGHKTWTSPVCDPGEVLYDGDMDPDRVIVAIPTPEASPKVP